MADIIHEHSDDSGNSAMLVIIFIIIVAIGGFLLWKYLPAREATPAQPGVTLQINNPVAPASPATTP